MAESNNSIIKAGLKISKMKVAFSIAVFLTVSLIVMLFWTSKQSLSFVHTIETVHFPAIEISSVVLRLEERINNQISKSLLFKTYDPSIIQLSSAFKVSSSELFDYSTDYNDWGMEVAEKSAIRFKSFEDYILIIEDMDRLIQRKNFEDAQELYLSEKYKDVRGQVVDQLNKEIKFIVELKNSVLKNYSSHLNLFLWELFVSFLFLGSTWFFMLRAYNRSLNEKKEAEERYEKQRIVSAQNMKLIAIGEMAGNIAHEINNPLAVIRGYSQQLMRLRQKQKEVDPQKAEEMLSKIVNTTDRISNIVKSLLKLSRNPSSSEKTWQSLGSIIQDSVNLCGEKFAALGIQVNVEVFNTEDHMIYCHPIEISQVVLNLLNNSADAIEGSEAPWIRVRSHLIGEDRLQLVLTDSGKGIAKEIREKIMTPYFSTKPEGKGTGLGLSISSTIIAESGGFLFYNEEASNTEFILEFPAVLKRASTGDEPSGSKQKSIKNTAA